MEIQIKVKMYFSRHGSSKVVLYSLTSSQKSTGQRQGKGSSSPQGQSLCVITKSGNYFEVVVSKQICKVKTSKYSHFSRNDHKINFMTP